MRNLAAAAQRAAGLPSNGVQGMVIERDALDELVERLAALPAAERPSVPGIKPARADLILAGAVVVRECCDAGGFDGIEATEAGLREGVFFERLLVGPRRRRCSRTSGARASLNMAAQYRVDGPHTEHVAALALGHVRRAGRARPARRATRASASCCGPPAMLHDIGMSIDYDDHHKHSRYLILNGGLPGFAPVETAIIAQAARYHRKGMPSPGPMAALFGEGDVERLNRCAALLRLAEDLERSRDQLVRGTDMALDGEERAAAPDRRRRPGRAALGGRARARAVRARLRPRAVGRAPERPARSSRGDASWQGAVSGGGQRRFSPGAVEQHEAERVGDRAVPFGRHELAAGVQHRLAWRCCHRAWSTRRRAARSALRARSPAWPGRGPSSAGSTPL